MKILHEALEHALGRLPNEFLSQLIARKLAARGVKLSPRELGLVAEQLIKGERGTFRFRRWHFWEQTRIQLELTPTEIQEAERKITEFIETQLPELIRTSADDLAEKILRDLKSKWRTESRKQRRESTAFSKRLYKRWGMPIEALKILLTISREFGARINDETRDAPELEHRKHLVEVLTRCHARSCQITEEILCLLAAGLADGAMARWRTLHEVAVAALFIAANGEDLAERYILHQVVESRRAAEDYDKFRERLGLEPLKVAEVRNLEIQFAALKTRFGRDFIGSYGWAAHTLKKQKPTFADIERSTGIDHLRPYYRMASHNVHANPMGVFFKLGLVPESRILLAGPSHVGLADPGQSAAISLAQVSSAVGSLNLTLDNVIALKMIMLLAREVGEAFVKVQASVEDDARKLGVSARRF